MREPSADGGRTLGVYVHVPFCARRRDYCAFATWAGLHHLSEAYVDAGPARPQRNWAYDKGLGPAATVFFGGGTPSQLPGGVRSRPVARRRPPPGGSRGDLECNPEDVTVGLLRTYAPRRARPSCSERSRSRHMFSPASVAAQLRDRAACGCCHRRGRLQLLQRRSRSTAPEARPMTTGWPRSRECSVSTRRPLT